MDGLRKTSGVAAGLLLGALVWGLILGIQVQRYEPGLWTLRVQCIVNCGLDYNGPPFRQQGEVLWLTCGSDDNSWQLWPFAR